MLQAMDDGICQFSRQFENSATGPDAAAVQGAYAAIRAHLPALPRQGAGRAVASLLDIAPAVDAFLLDAWGVLNRGARPVPGVAARLAELRAMGKVLRVVTNDGSRDGAQAVAKFRALGYDFAAAEIITARGAALAAAGPFRRAGGRWGVMGLADAIPGAIALADDPADYAVACGFLLLDSSDWTPARQARLEAALRAHPRRVVVGNPDLVSPDLHGFNVEPGYWAHRLRETVGVEPEFHGKPFPSVFAAALASLPEIDPARVVMVGDTPQTDILGGAAAGCRTALVTGHGILRGQDVRASLAAAAIRPDWLLDSP